MRKFRVACSISCLVVSATQVGACAVDDGETAAHSEGESALEKGLKNHNGISSTNGLGAQNALVTQKGAKGVVFGCSSSNKVNRRLSAWIGTIDPTLASYVVRCALPATASVGGFKGELGLAPEWATEPCKEACQEKITSCLLSLSNGKGEHVGVVLTSPDFSGPRNVALRYSKSLAQEGIFFGNLFTCPATMYMALGSETTSIVAGRYPRVGQGEYIDVNIPRMCQGIVSDDPTTFLANASRCPFTVVGTAYGSRILDVEGLCQSIDNQYTAAWCEYGGKQWNHPMSVAVKPKRVLTEAEDPGYE